MRKYGWIGLLVLLGITFVWLIKAPLIAAYLTQRVGLPLHIRGASVWPSELQLRVVHISNPKGFKDRHALDAKSIVTRYQIGDLFADPVKIQELIVRDVILNIDHADPPGTENNWKVLLQKISPRSKTGRGAHLHKIVFENLTLTHLGGGLAAVPKTTKVDRLEIEHIQSDQGFPTAELIRRVFAETELGSFVPN